MELNKRFIDFYMDVAHRTAELSRAVRLKVGAIIVKDTRITSIGYNGTPAGWDNNCEYEIGHVLDDNGNIVESRLKTKPEVIHAEMNALMKLARSSESGEGATLFITHSPCIDCAKSIAISGIKKVYYRTSYRNDDGIALLEKSGIYVEQCNQ
jgi:dCMP deaminase